MPHNTNIHDIRPSAANQVRADLDALRSSVAQAWRERGVMLTREERSALKREIEDTCQFLSDLIQSGD